MPGPASRAAPMQKKRTGLHALFGVGHLTQAGGDEMSETQQPPPNPCHLPREVLTPLDLEVDWHFPRRTQIRQRALGTFVPHFRVGNRVYYRRAAVEQWIAEQESASQGDRDA